MTSNFDDNKIALQSSSSHVKPDDDAIKLFVGQIPRSITEGELRGFMEEFGTIHQLSILKDHATGDSKGCCFLTYHSRQSALNAIKGLHGLKILPGAKHPMQVKPAEGAIEKEEDRRLFVGMIGKETTEDDLKSMFSPFGNIDSCVVLKERDGTSRGCAFIIFTVRKSAVKAISALHHSMTMEGCRAPLVVKFADTQKDKAASKNSRGTSSMDGQPDSAARNNTSGQDGWSHYATSSMPPPAITSSFAIPTAMPSINGYPGFSLGPTSFPPPSAMPPGIPSAPGIAQFPGMPGAPVVPQFPGIPNLQQLQSQLQSIAALAALATSPLLTSLLNPNLAMLQQLNASASNGTRPAANPGSDLFNQALASVQQYNAQSFPTSATSSAASDSSQTFYSNNNSSSGHQKDGSNLFLLHLPSEYREGDLQKMFSPYGRVVSAKVLIDDSGRSKCYGFVSYDNPASAQSAINALNGHMINGRRLKVQLKGKREDKPY